MISCLHGWFFLIIFITINCAQVWGIRFVGSSWADVSFSSILPIPPPSPIFQWPPLGLLVVTVQNSEVISCRLREPISWGDVGHIGDPVAKSLGVMAWKLWLLPPSSPGTQLRALLQPLCRAWLQSLLPLVSVTWRWVSYFLLWLCLLSFSFYSLCVFLCLLCLYGMTWKMNLKCHLFFFFLSFKCFLLL